MKYRDRKIPKMVLKSVEEKAMKAVKATAPRNTIAQAESRKRKAAGVPKVVSKRWKSTRSSKAASAKEVAENAPVGSAAVPTSAEAGQSVASAAGGDEDLMPSALQGLGDDTILGAPDVVPMPSMFSDGGDSSNSEDDEVDAGGATASDSDEAASAEGAQSAKAPHLEEFEVESKERPPPA